MVTMREVQAQFFRLGVKQSFWARAEIRELPHILVPGEQLTQVVMGWYKGGFALLCCTDQRVLLVDKKPLFLTLEDLRYDMIAEVMYQYRMLDASLILTYAGKELHFKAWNQTKLREVASYVQQRVMEVRQYDQHGGFASQPSAQPGTAQQPQSSFVWQDQHGNTGFQQLSPGLPFSSFDPGTFWVPPKNPYQAVPAFRRRKLSRFITTSQMGPAIDT